MESKKRKRTSPSNMTIQTHISNLPDDCLIHIFSLLPIIDKLMIKRVCKHWRSLSLLSWNNCKTLDMGLKAWGLGLQDCEKINKRSLNEVLKDCGKYLNCIDFTQYWPVRDGRKWINGTKSLFEEFKKYCPNLTSIRLGEVRVRKQGLEYLAKTQTDLKEIRLTCFENCNEALSLLFQNNRNLRIVGFLNCNINCWLDLNPEPIEEIYLGVLPENLQDFCNALERFVHLRVFSVQQYNDSANFMKHIDQILEIISLHGKKLEMLIVDCSSSSYYLTSRYFQYFPNLQKFHLAGEQMGIHNKFFKKLTTHCTKITSLKLRYSAVTDRQLSYIINLQELKVLHLSHLENVTDCIFIYCPPSITEVVCSGCPRIGNLGLHELLHAKNLKYLFVNECNNVNYKKLVEGAKEIFAERFNGPHLKMDLVYNRNSSFIECLSDTDNISKYLEINYLIKAIL